MWVDAGRPVTEGQVREDGIIIRKLMRGCNDLFNKCAVEHTHFSNSKCLRNSCFSHGAVVLDGILRFLKMRSRSLSAHYTVRRGWIVSSKSQFHFTVHLSDQLQCSTYVALQLTGSWEAQVMGPRR